MKLFCIGAGIFFIANPVIGVYDYLPDFIGCLLIMLGIRDGAYMIEKLESSRRWFMYAAWLSFVRFGVSFADIESQHTLPLTLAFAFAIVEVIVYIPAFRDLFLGFDYAAMRHGGSEVLSMGRRMGFYYDENGVRQYGEIQDDTTGRITRFSQVFIIVRAVASLLPELPALELADSENLGDVSGFHFSSVGTLIGLVTFVIVLIPAIILVVKYLKFLHKIKKSGDLVPRIEEELHKRFGDLTELHTCRRMKLLGLIMGIAVILYMGFYDYQINVIPRYIDAAVVCLVSVMLFIFSGKRVVNLLPILPAIATVPVSIKVHALQEARYGLYKLQMMNLYESGNEYIYDRNINFVDDEYLIMAKWETVEAVIMGVALILLLVLYIGVCLRHGREFRSVPERYRKDIAVSLRIRGGLAIGVTLVSVAYFTAYRYILPTFDAAYMVGVGINVISTAVFAALAIQANQHVYDNLHGVTVSPKTENEVSAEREE